MEFVRLWQTARSDHYGALSMNTGPAPRQVPLAPAVQIDDATDTVVRFRVKTAHKSSSKPAE